MKSIRATLAFALVSWLLGLSQAIADDAVAQDNATVQPAGPRMPPNGKNFFNVEGRPNTDNASFGVLEFSTADLQLGQIGDIAQICVTLTQDLASFTSRGALRFYVTTDNVASLQSDPVNPDLVFDPSDVHGLGTQLTTLYDLGTGAFNPIRGGWVDVYCFTNIPQAAKDYAIAQINAGDILRIIIAPEASDVDMELVGATWDGAGNANPNVRPRLTVVPQ